MLAFSCSGCGRSFSLNDEIAGKKTKCPQCGNPLVVPAAAETQVHTQPADTNVPPGAAPDRANWLAFLVPYQNLHSLGAYYTGVFALIPFGVIIFLPLAYFFQGHPVAASSPKLIIVAPFGVILGLAALVAGIFGFINSRSANRGMFHSIIGCICGAVVFLSSLLALFIGLVVMASAQNRQGFW